MNHVDTPSTPTDRRTNAATSKLEPTSTSSERRHGKGTHRRIGSLHVLNLAGSFAEMGEQHGALLATEVAAGPIPYFRNMVERLLGKPLGKASPLVASALQRVVGARVQREMPSFVIETARGIARGAGIDEDTFLRGCTMPDSLIWLTSQMFKMRGPGPAVAHRLSLGLGCTSAVAWGSATSDGKLYHARNFDYFGVDNWPNHAAVLFHSPDQGQRYVSVAAAGVGLGGITAMNASGLSLTVHQHMFTDKARLGGLPIGIVGDIIMREATSLAEAEAILRRHRSIGCWTYVITSAREKRVLCFEENPDRKVAIYTKPEDTTFSYANIYLDEALGATEVAAYGSYWRHNRGRFARAKELVENGKGKLDAHGMAKILADRGDPRCRIRDSIAMVMTVGSVVFRPEDGTVWLGVGDAPTSRATFIPLSLETGAHAPERGSFQIDDGAATSDEAAFQSFRKAYVAYVDGMDVEGAMNAVAEAARLAPKQALFHSTEGLLAVEGLATDRAELAFSRAIELGHPDQERVAAFYLWRGRARDLAGRREQAQRDYRLCLAHVADAPVHVAARKGLKRAFTASAAKRMHIEMSLGDVVQP